MKVSVDQDKCIGCGACVAACPKVFKLGEDGKSQVKDGADLEANKDKIQAAATGCPASAIIATE